MSSAFENLSLNVAGALACVGIDKLAQVAGTQAPRSNLLSPSQYSQNVPPVHKTNWGMFAAVTVGLAALVGLVVSAARTYARNFLLFPLPTTQPLRAVHCETPTVL